MDHRVVIWGASGHAKVAAGILRAAGFEISGFIDEINPDRRGEIFCGSLVCDTWQDLINFQQNGINNIIIAFGNNKQRYEKGLFAEALGFNLINAIHRSAVIAEDITIGAGSLVAAGAIVNPGSTIGRLAIINTAASVDHDCVIGEGVHIGPGVRIAGHVTVGKCAWLGIGSTVIDKVRIGANSMVAAGAVVIADVQEAVLVAGVPAKVKKYI
jgi:UDP-N-acetylbacillosamine N-acetyltransferase